MLRLDRVNLSVGGAKLFSDLSFEIASGQRLLLQAPSGRGKSTLFRAIMGFFPIEQGDIYVGGLKLIPSQRSQIRKKISWLPQGGPPLKETLSAELERIDRFRFNSEIINFKKIFINYLDCLGLPEDVMFRDFPRLSGGEKQRAGLALCAVLDRPFVLLDEPISALDRKAAELTVDFIESELHGAVLMAGHDPYLERRFPGRIRL